MFWFVRIFVMLVLVVVLVVGLGFLLPHERRAVKTTLIDAPPERVYQIVTDVEKHALWRSDVKRLQVENRGDLWTWTEDLSSGTTLSVEETAKQPLERYELKFVTSQGIRGLWICQFEPSNEGRTKLTLTETVTIDNPLLRVGAYVMLNLDTIMDVYLGDLNRYASESNPLRPDGPRPRKQPIGSPKTLEPLEIEP